MSSNEVEDQAKELEEGIEECTAALESVDDPVERESILKDVSSKQEELFKLSKPSESETRKSSRTRHPTTKMAELQEADKVKREGKLKKVFVQNYESWKECCKNARQKLKGYCTGFTLNDISSSLHIARDELIDAYDACRQLGPPEQEMRRRVDTCSAITQQLLKVVVAKEDADTTHISSELRRLLHTDDNASVFSSKASSQASSRWSESSSARRAKAAAELAARKAEIKVLEVKQQKQAELDELQRQQEEMQRLQEKKRREIERLEKEKELETARAKFEVYDQECKGSREKSHSSNSPDEPSPWPTEVKHEAQKKQPSPVQASEGGEVAALARSLRDCMTIHKLPPPEPSVFTGDPIRYVEWKASFKTLIESKAISTPERVYYLKRYLGGDAQKAVEGFFYSTSDESYEGAWRLLEERYGHPFKVQKAFRDKLSKWQKIGPKDANSLQQFADFLKACKDAIPHVPALKILDDCEENRRLLSKLPDWAAARWNRQVTKKLDETLNYPGFEEFVEFVRKEARVACNPISSLHALKATDESETEQTQGGSRRANRSRGTALTVGSNEINKMPKEGQTSTKSMFQPKPCQNCRKTDHHIDKCPGFGTKSLAERRKFIQENRLCFGCLKKGHLSKECRRKLTCDKCKRRHPTILHDDALMRSDDSNHVEKSPKGEKPKEVAVVSCGVQMGSGWGTSMIVPVWVSSVDSPSMEVLTYALLDTQSDCTFILDNTASSIAARCESVRLKLATMTSASSMIDCSAVTNLIVRGMHSSNRIRIPRAYTREFIPVNKSTIPTTDTARRWPHLERITHEMAPLQNCEVGMLIGYNCPQALAPRDTIVGQDDEPYAVKTDLGWTIVGYDDPSANSYATSVCHRVSATEAPCIPPSNVIRALEADFSEKRHAEKTVSQEDIQFLNIMEKNIHQTSSGHYTMPLPFRDGKPTLPNNKKTAIVRLNHLNRKFSTNQKYHADYTKFMEDVIEKGDAEKVESHGEEGRVWYIPHHGVYHPRKPGKIRVVFDCSARHAGTSLNGHLLTGPDLINNLTGVLLRFREHPIAVMCDIERMFHQFLVNEEDRDYLRFLWWENGDPSNGPAEYRMKVHLFGAASSPGCANYGLKHLASRHENEFPLAATFVKRNFYVDDGLKSTETEDEAKRLVAEAQELCARGGLRLHKFISTSREVMEAIPVDERAAGVKDVDLSRDDLPTERALGIQWCVEADMFNFHIEAKDQSLTRRGILSTVASIYDPLGFLAPFVLIGKGILQEMCHSGSDWDDPLPDKLHPRWEKWKDDLVNLKQIQIPRCYKPSDFGKVIAVELHHFCDASTRGYGQCSYLRFIGEDKVHCTLVSGKARVAPIKVVTIPRLELTAAVVSVQISHMLKEELELVIDREYFWTDSQVVLGYICNEARRFHVFVANRVQKIRQYSEPSQWHYVPTEVNPADHASRGVLAKELVASNWFRGPEFLWNKEMVIAEEPVRELSVGDPEVKSVTSLQSAVTPEVFDWEDRLSRFSDWSKVLGAVARIRRLNRKEKDNSLSTPQEQTEAEMHIVRSVQRQAFPQEIQSLRNSSRVKATSKICSLNPFLDSDGILRVGGRLRNAEVPDSVKHPAILPKDGQVTRLLISYFHNKVQHQGRGMTFNEVRAGGYWIIGGVKVVATHIHKCATCRRLRRPVEEQKMADLPKDRVEPSPPFTFCGMDCFGPFTVREGRKEIKKYGVIFTCMSSRAVHIEMVDDMTTDCFINSLRCFIALRGPVQQLRSDQGSNFVGAKNEFREALKELDMERVQGFLAKRQCQFVMNAPHSSHVGGVWERQIKTVRSVLSSIIQQSPGRLDAATLRTFLYEAMAIVNSRPLTTVNLHDPLSPEPLTPNHLLTMKSTAALPPPGKFVKEDLYIRKRWRRVQYLAEQFWGRWRKEYLSSLTSRQKWHTPRRNIKVGDVVLLKDEEAPRMEWPLAIVIETIENDDGLVRRARVRVGTKHLDKEGRRTGKPSILERPIQKLILLLETK
ncbi:uncharacterized protein LOC119739571 [Patiria miniata]|nr:uncharacterized protein LOC119739571 [Patiria miniata]